MQIGYIQGRVDDTSPSDSNFRPSYIASGCTLSASRKTGFQVVAMLPKATRHLFYLEPSHIHPSIHLNLASEDSTDGLCFLAQTAVTLLKVAHRYRQWHLLNDQQNPQYTAFVMVYQHILQNLPTPALSSKHAT